MEVIEYKPEKPAANICANKGTNIDAVISMRNAGMPISAIAKQVDTSKSNIQGILKRYKFKLDKTENFKKHESIIQTGVKEKIVKSIAHVKI